MNLLNGCADKSAQHAVRAVAARVDGWYRLRANPQRKHDLPAYAHFAPRYAFSTSSQHTPGVGLRIGLHPTDVSGQSR